MKILKVLNNIYKIVGFTAKPFHNQFQKWNMVHREHTRNNLAFFGKVLSQSISFEYWTLCKTRWDHMGSSERFCEWNLMKLGIYEVKSKVYASYALLYFVVRSLSIFMKLFQVSIAFWRRSIRPCFFLDDFCIAWNFVYIMLRLF